MKPGFLVGVVFFSLHPTLVGQGKTNIGQEVKFLRGLAKDWGFVELAQQRLSELRRAPTTTEDQQRKLAQVSPEVLFLGARRIPDIQKRKAVLAKSLQEFKDYLSQYGRSEGATDVLAAQAEACEYYGSFLSSAIAVEKDPDKKKALEEEALGVFVNGIKASNEAMNSLEGRKGESPRAKVNYYLSWMRKGTLLREWAKTITKDRKVKANEAINTLEELALDIGEETAIGIKALLEMAVAQSILGDTENALDSYQGTIEIVVEAIKSTEVSLPLSTQALMFRFLEEAYGHMTDMYVAAGDVDKAIAAVEAYKKQRTELNLPSTPRFADVVLLNGAQARLDQGKAEGVAAALETAKQVAGRHPADFLGVRAREIINSALSGGTVTVGPEALFQAAQGERQKDRFASAIRGFKRTLRALKKPEDKKHYGLRAWAQIGLSFAKQQRFLEATYAFGEGLRKFGANADDKSLGSKVVDYLKNSARRLSKQKGDKKFAERIQSRADALARRYSTGASKWKLLYSDGRDLIEKKKFTEAVARLSKITKESPLYELALATTGFAYMKAGDFVKARKALNDYLAYVKDPLNAIGTTPADQTRAQYRQFALADTHFFLGMMIADEAFGRNGKKADPSKKKAVVQAFRNYGKTYGKVRPESADRATFELIKALIDLERITEGETEYDRFRKEFPNSPQQSALAIILFNARKTQVDAIEQEISALQGNPAKAREMRDATRRLRAEVHKALSFAKTYMAAERHPAYAMLRAASKLAARIDEFDQAELFLEKIVAVHGKSKKYGKNIDAHIRPELAEIKMRKGDFNTALAQIDDALKVRPKSYNLMWLKARALGGWIEFDADGSPRRTQGLQKFKEAYLLLFQDYGKYVKSKKVKKYSLQWYRWVLACLDMSDKLMRVESDFRRARDSFYSMGKNTDNFASLKKLGPEGNRLYLLFQRLKP